jgi:hypothetical protein
VAPPKEFQSSGGFGSHRTVFGSSGGGGNGQSFAANGKLNEMPFPKSIWHFVLLHSVLGMGFFDFLLTGCQFCFVFHSQVV